MKLGMNEDSKQSLNSDDTRGMFTNFFLTAKERTKSSTHLLVHKQHNYMYAYDACTYSDVNSACTPLHKFLSPGTVH